MCDVKIFGARARALSLMIIDAKDPAVAQCGGVKHFFVHCFFSHIVLYFLLSAVNGAGEAQGIVGRTPPQSAARTKSRPAKTPTQTGEPVHTHYIPFSLFFSLFFFFFKVMVIFIHFLVPRLAHCCTSPT